MSHGTHLFESLKRLEANWGSELDLSDIPAGLKRCGVTTDTRVKLNTGEFGYIGITTGPKPALLLLRTRRVMGSSRVLTADDYVVALRGERGYVPWYTFDDERPATSTTPKEG